MKVGQLMSMGGDDMLPPEMAEILAKLREQAHHMPPPQLRRVLNEAWGEGWMARLGRFDPRPIAAASIGQVHRAQTKDGEDLAIKVQYPGVRESIDSDVSGLDQLNEILEKRQLTNVRIVLLDEDSKLIEEMKNGP